MNKKLLAAATLFVSFATLSFSTLSVAGEADVKKALETTLGKVEKISKAPITGLWEVVVDGQIFYVEDTGRYVLAGNLIDTKTGKNLTTERQFNALPLELAIKQVRGNGKNVLVTFEDPNCGYCKKLAKELTSVKNLTLYTFLYPVLGEDSFEKSKMIWCAQDKAKAWNDSMIAGKTLASVPAKCDTTGLEKSIALGQKLRISGTPAMFFATGERVGGYIPAAEIEKRFNAKGS